MRKFVSMLGLLTGLLWGFGSPGPRWWIIGGPFATEPECVQSVEEAAALAVSELAVGLRCYAVGIDPARVHPVLFYEFMKPSEPTE